MLRCAAIFTDHMVLMRDKPVCIWGEYDGTESVEVIVDGTSTNVQPSKGQWKTYLPAHKAGGPFEVLVRAGEETLTFTDVYFGEVFLASGQSNMEFMLQESQGGLDEVARANHSLIRYYNVFKTGYIDDQVEESIKEVQWKSCIGEDSKEVSAIAYYASKVIQEELDVPIGIIDCYQGGTSIRCWLPEDVLKEYALGQRYLKEHEEAVAGKTDEDYDREMEEYWKIWHVWDDKVQELKAVKPDANWEEVEAYAGNGPWPQPVGNKSLFRPAGAYSSMLETIMPYTLSGVFFYQGESDSDFKETAVLYEELMEALIIHWRKCFENEDLYFVITQLTMFLEKGVEDPCIWPITREAQLHLSQRMHRVGLLGIADCGEYGNIHPTDKRTPGERLGNLYLEECYGLSRQGKSMIPKRIYAQENKVFIECENTYGEILAERLDTAYFLRGLQNVLAVFEVAGEDGIYYPCDFFAENDSIILKVPEGIHAKTVRYAWKNYANVRVFNGAHIPLVPFGARRIEEDSSSL